MATVEVVCYKYKPLKNGELPIKIKVCKDRKTRYITLVFLPDRSFGILDTSFPFKCFVDLTC